MAPKLVKMKNHKKETFYKDSNNNEFWEVKKVVAKRKVKNNKIEYFVVWSQGTPDENCWVEKQDTFAEKIAKFERKHSRQIKKYEKLLMNKSLLKYI